MRSPVAVDGSLPPGATGAAISVLHVIDSLNVGGTESGMCNLIEATRGLVAHHVCAIRAGGAMVARLEAAGVGVTTLHAPAGVDWRLAWRIAGLCRQLRPAIVHTRNWGTVDGIVGARLARVPVVVHGEHGRHADDPAGTNRRRQRIRRVLAPWLDRIITVSDQLRAWLVSDCGISARKVQVIRNGVDIARFRAGVDPGLRQSLGLRNDDFVVGTVGRLDPVKDQGALIDAVAHMCATLPHTRLLIIGDGPERERLERQIVARGLSERAVMLGQRTDVHALLPVLDVFVLPSLGEGLCNTILEAMAAGRPVVATRVGGNPELVTDGQSGFLVPPRDPLLLAEAIGRYAGSPALGRAHGTFGRARVEAEFSIDAMARTYMALYGQQLGSRSRGGTPCITPSRIGSA